MHIKITCPESLTDLLTEIPNHWCYKLKVLTVDVFYVLVVLIATS